MSLTLTIRLFTNEWQNCCTIIVHNCCIAIFVGDLQTFGVYLISDLTSTEVGSFMKNQIHILH